MWVKEFFLKERKSIGVGLLYISFRNLQQEHLRLVRRMFWLGSFFLKGSF